MILREAAIPCIGGFVGRRFAVATAQGANAAILTRFGDVVLFGGVIVGAGHQRATPRIS